MTGNLTPVTFQASHALHVRTRGQGLYEVTDMIRRWVEDTGINSGLLTVFCRHTSASLTIQENADPDVQLDLDAFLSRLVQQDSSLYRHTVEGPDDMPAHIRSALTDSSLSIPIMDGVPVLGTWQGIYLFEHRASSHQRELRLHILG